MPRIRSVSVEDAPAIAAIYNPYVLETSISFEEEPVDAAEMASRIQKVTQSHPWLVWEEKGEVLGYAYASSWRSRNAYRHTAESSLYIRQDCRRMGIGSQLYLALLDSLRQGGFHSVLGCLALPNDPSVALHEKLGFRKAGHMSQAGLKFGQWIDVGFWELLL